MMVELSDTQKLDLVLRELHDIRIILEGLMQPLVTVGPTDRERWTAPIRPFGSVGVQEQ